MLKALAGPFAHTGVKFLPTGGINAGTLPNYLALPQVAAVGGSWMAEKKLVAEESVGKNHGDHRRSVKGGCCLVRNKLTGIFTIYDVRFTQHLAKERANRKSYIANYFPIVTCSG